MRTIEEIEKSIRHYPKSSLLSIRDIMTAIKELVEQERREAWNARGEKIRRNDSRFEGGVLTVPKYPTYDDFTNQQQTSNGSELDTRK